MNRRLRVIVCGGRNFNGKLTLYDILDDLHHFEGIAQVIHGNARGADALAGKWARERGIEEVPCPALWEKYGKSAGIKRNEYMLTLSPDKVVAFPGGRGTAHMIRIAREANIEVLKVEDYIE